MAHRTVGPRRLSASPLWASQRRFYARAGVDAWRTATVPHHVTSNVALATAYARVVLGFLGDGAPREPVHVVELGAGCGRFAFLFLRALDALAPSAPLHYVMTDVAARTVAFWRAHAALRPYVRSGRLDFARFDGERDARLRLLSRGRTIGPASPVRRLVIVANYVFGGFRQDAFAVGGGPPHAYLVEARDRAAAAPADLVLAWRRDARVAAPYPEAGLARLLRDYGEAGAGGYVLVPVGMLRCLDRLAALVSEDLLVLAADRGTFTPREAVTGARDLQVARHGALSFPGSFHALAAWAAARHGLALRPRARPRHLCVAASVVGRGGPRRWRATRAAWQGALASGTPDALYAERRRAGGTRPLRASLSLIERCGPDPRVIAECARALWPHLPLADAAARRRIRDLVLAAWPNHFHVGEPEDVPFHLALVLYGVRAYAEAAALFHASVREHGDDAATRWNLGLCQAALGRPGAARAAFGRARALAPGLAAAGPVTVKLGARPR